MLTYFVEGSQDQSWPMTVGHNDCNKTIADTIKTLDKYLLLPMQEIIYLWFIINSNENDSWSP